MFIFYKKSNNYIINDPGSIDNNMGLKPRLISVLSLQSPLVVI